jgi:hypothetical protein
MMVLNKICADGSGLLHNMSAKAKIEISFKHLNLLVDFHETLLE